MTAHVHSDASNHVRLGDPNDSAQSSFSESKGASAFILLKYPGSGGENRVVSLVTSTPG